MNAPAISRAAAPPSHNVHQDPQQQKLPEREEVEFALDENAYSSSENKKKNKRTAAEDTLPTNAAAVDAPSTSPSASKRPCRASSLLSKERQKVNLDSSLYTPPARNIDLNLVALGIPAVATHSMMRTAANLCSTMMTDDNHVALGILALAMPTYPVQPAEEPASSSVLPSLVQPPQADGLHHMDTATDDFGLSLDTIDDLFVEHLLWGIGSSTTTDHGHEEEEVALAAEEDDALMSLLLKEQEPISH